MITKSVLRISAFCFLCSSSTVFAWGARGHEVVNRSAVTLSTSPFSKFLTTNIDRLGALAVVPDSMWKKPATATDEKPMHFFQWDSYGDSSIKDSIPDTRYLGAQQALGLDYVNTNGSAPWRAHSIYMELVKSLKEKDFEKAIQYAGVMGHYIGDLSQPMHVTSDYDGQSVHAPGAHKYFETILVEKTDRDTLVKSVVALGSKMPITLCDGKTSAEVMVGTVIVEAKSSYAGLPEVLKNFTKPYNDTALIELGKTHMARGAKTLSLIWDKAFADSGLKASDLPTTALDVPNPDWEPIADEL